jgi:hypothetical protein
MVRRMEHAEQENEAYGADCSRTPEGAGGIAHIASRRSSDVGLCGLFAKSFDAMLIEHNRWFSLSIATVAGRLYQHHLPPKPAFTTLC